MRMFVWLSVEWFHKSIHEGLAKFLQCRPLQIDHVIVQAPNTWVKIKHAELHSICAPPSFSLRPASSSPLPLQKQRMRNALIESPGHSQISIETLQQSLMLGYLKYCIPRSITSWAHSHHPFRPVVPFPKTSANPRSQKPTSTYFEKKKKKHHWKWDTLSIRPSLLTFPFTRSGLLLLLGLCLCRYLQYNQKRHPGNGGYGLMIQRNSNLKKMPPQKGKLLQKVRVQIFFIFWATWKNIRNICRRPSFPPDLPSSLSSLPSLVPSSWELASLSLPFAGRFVSIHKTHSSPKNCSWQSLPVFLETHGAFPIGQWFSQKSPLKKVIPPFLQCDKP